MENATKALLIAAGMLFAMMILSLMVYAYSMFTGFQQSKVNATREEQINEFNLEYESYNRKDVRGIELYTLYAKIQDYNARVDDDTTMESGAKKIKTNIANVLNSALSSEGKTFKASNGTDKATSLTSSVKGYYFKCKEIKYDSSTSRVCEINFEGPLKYD